MNKKLSFKGGIHPDFDGKSLSSGSPIRRAPLLALYRVPAAQNAGKPPKILVSPGDEVKKYELIAEADGFVSANLHSPTSGKVAAITTITGVGGTPVAAIEIVSDMLDTPAELPPPLDWRRAEPDELRRRIAACGVVGMGGAAFPTHVKISPPPGKNIDTLIINGAECEPYLTADHRLMIEEPVRILEGAAITGHILKVKRVVVGVEGNKPDAINMLKLHAAEFGVEVVELAVQYPQGSEKQLIGAIAGRTVPSGGLPMDAGCVIQNVASAAAVRDAVCDGIPLIERVVTITGDAVNTPGNWLLRIGTPFLAALELAGGISAEPGKFILGGPMMGFAQRDFSGSVAKNSSGMLLLKPAESVTYGSASCIRCGRCVAGCPMRLNPGLLATAIESGRFDWAGEHFVMDCLECGSCAYVCPAHRPLVQHMRRGKAEVRKSKK